MSPATAAAASLSPAGTPRPVALLVGEPPQGALRALRPELDLRTARGREALAAFERERPALLLLDAREPEGVLETLLSRVGSAGRADRPSVIVLTHDAANAGSLAAAADDVVGAGFGLDVLLARVRCALRVQDMARELERMTSEMEALSGRLESMAARMAEELRLAAQVQRTLLPSHLVHRRLDVAAECLPVRDIGGDYYDLIPLDEERLCVAVGDVMGKGVPAALLAANLKACLRAHVQAEAADPAQTLLRVNRLFRDVVPRGLFATLFFAILDPARGLDYVNAGHQPGLLLRARDGEADLGRGGPALGLLEEPDYETGHEPLLPGDTLALWSDGISDRASPAGEPFGRERIRGSLVSTRGDAARIALYALLGDVQGWSGGAPAEDDQTVILASLRRA